MLQVDMKSSGKTALQVASHQGHKEIVQILLTAGANLELQDEDGDSALHYSAFGSVLYAPTISCITDLSPLHKSQFCYCQ